MNTQQLLYKYNINIIQKIDSIFLCLLKNHSQEEVNKMLYINTFCHLITKVRNSRFQDIHSYRNKTY